MNEGQKGSCHAPRSSRASQIEVSPDEIMDGDSITDALEYCS